MIKLLTFLASIALFCTNEVFAQELYAKSDLHELNPSPKTVVWGYYWAETKLPALGSEKERPSQKGTNEM